MIYHFILFFKLWLVKTNRKRKNPEINNKANKTNFNKMFFYKCTL